GMHPARPRGTGGTRPPPARPARRRPPSRALELAPVVALFAGASDPPLAPAAALGQEGRTALGARLGNRPLPGYEAAVLGVRAGKIGPASLRASLRELATAALGTRDAERDRLDVLALGVSRAADEAAEPTLLEHHRLAAQVAVDPRRLWLRLGAVP